MSYDYNMSNQPYQPPNAGYSYPGQNYPPQHGYPPQQGYPPQVVYPSQPQFSPQYIPQNYPPQSQYPPQGQYPYTPNYIAPNPNCEKCKGTGYRLKHGENKKCKCVKKQEKEMEKKMKKNMKEM